MVEVYGKKAHQINAQDPAHRCAYTPGQTCAVSVWKARKEVEEKKGGKKLPVPGRELKGKAPGCIATFTLHKDPWLQLLYEYHEGYILNSMHNIQCT